MTKLKTVAAVVTLVLPALLSAQTANPQTNPPGKPQASASKQPDSNFVTKALHDGNTEIALSQMALTQSTNASLKAAAEKIRDDHKKAGDELKAIGRSKNVALPGDTELGPEGEAARKMLEKSKGADFDKMWVNHMIADHNKAIAMFQAEAKSSDAELKAFAEKTLPTLREHLAMVQKLK